MIKAVDSISSFKYLNNSVKNKTNSIDNFMVNNTVLYSKAASDAIKANVLSNISFLGLSKVIKDKGQFDDLKRRAFYLTQDAHEMSTNWDESKEIQMRAENEYERSNDVVHLGKSINWQKIHYTINGYETKILFKTNEGAKQPNMYTEIFDGKIKRITYLDASLKPQAIEVYGENKDASRKTKYFYESNGQLMSASLGYKKTENGTICDKKYTYSNGDLRNISQYVKRTNGEMRSLKSYYYGNNGDVSRCIIDERHYLNGKKTYGEVFSMQNGKLAQYTKGTEIKRNGEVFVDKTIAFEKDGYVQLNTNTRY